MSQQAHPVAAERIGAARPPGPGRSGSEQAKDIWDLAVFGHPGDACRSPPSASPGCARPLSSGRLRICRATAAAAPPTSGRRSTRWRGCRKACAAGPTTETSRPRWAGPTSRTSSAGSATWNRPGQSAATTATSICRGARTILDRDPRARPDPPRASRRRAARRLRHRDRRHPRRTRARRARTRPATRDHDRAVRQPGHPAVTARSGSPPRSPSTPDGGPKTSSACRWTAWPAIKTAAAVLVYDNAKANRMGRRLPIGQATATVITGQQGPCPRPVSRHSACRAEAAAGRAIAIRTAASR